MTFRNIRVRRGSGTLAISVIVVLWLVAAWRVAGGQSLWADEIFSLAIATGHSLEHPAQEANAALGDYVEPPDPLPAAAWQRYLEHERPAVGPGRVIRAVRMSDTNPPLYYLLLNTWTRGFGESDRALRLFSVLCSLLAFPALGGLAHYVAGRPAVLPTITLFAASPITLYYSTEGRMYSLLCLLSIVLVSLTVRLRTSASGAGLTCWVLAGAAGLLTHYFYVFAWLACIVWLMAYPGRLARPWLVGAVLATTLLILPWYVLVPETAARWRITGYWLTGSSGWRQMAGAPLRLGWSFLSGGGHWASSRRAEWLALASIAVAAALAGRRLSTRVLFGRRLLLWLWLLLPCLGLPVFDLLTGTQTMWVPRYALAGMPAAILLLALALARVRLGARLALLALLLTAWSPGLVAIVTATSRNAEPYRKIGEWLTASLRGDDVVLAHSIPSGVLGIARYVDPAASIASWVGQLGQRRVPEDLVRLASHHDRVILVKIHEVAEPAPEQGWLEAHAHLLSQLRLENADVLTFLPRDGPRFGERRRAPQ